MVYYFSGTGNSRFVARELARLLADDVRELPVSEKITDQRPVVVVCPIYAWLVPEIVMTFLRRLGEKDIAIHLVVTCGDNVGRAIERVKQVVPLVSAHSVIMPNNYVIGFDIDSPAVQTEKINQAKGEIERIAQDIKQAKRVERYEKGRWAWHFGSLAGWLFQRFARGTSKFYADSACIGCEMCQRDCPVGAIQMADGRPKWLAPTCQMCLRCLHACPVEAIQYGKSTRKKGRYTYDKYLAKQQTDKY